MELAGRYGLTVIEDACQAHSAQYFSQKDNCWKTAGSIGHAAAFSFYPGKNLGACGEAGAVTTNDGAMAKTMKVIRDHGQAQKYYHDLEGYNGRLDAIQAGFLSVKLKHLPSWTEARRAAAKRYNDLLGNIDGIITPFESRRSKAVYHLYVIRTAKRDQERLTPRSTSSLRAKLSRSHAASKTSADVSSSTLRQKAEGEGRVNIARQFFGKDQD